MYVLPPPEMQQLAAEQAAHSASGTLLALRRSPRHCPDAVGTLQRGVLALGAALRQLERATPTILLLRPVARVTLVSEPSVVSLVRVNRGTSAMPPVTHRSLRDPALVQQDINGCKALLLEIIRRAAYDWVLYRESSRLPYKKMAEEAFVWLFEEGKGHHDWIERTISRKGITSFTAICDALDLDVLTVRRRIRGLTARHVMNVGRPAEYRRHDCSRVEETTVSAVDIEDHTLEHVSYEELEEEMHSPNRDY